MVRCICTVPLCPTEKTSVTRLAVFPKRDLRLFHRWIVAVGHPELSRRWAAALHSPELARRVMRTIYSSRRVCQRHFEARWIRDASPGTTRPMLHVGAVPTRFLPDTPVPPEFLKSDALEKLKGIFQLLNSPKKSTECSVIDKLVENNPLRVIVEKNQDSGIDFERSYIQDQCKITKKKTLVHNLLQGDSGLYKIKGYQTKVVSRGYSSKAYKGLKKTDHTYTNVGSNLSTLIHLTESELKNLTSTSSADLMPNPSDLIIAGEVTLQNPDVEIQSESNIEDDQFTSSNVGLYLCRVCICSEQNFISLFSFDNDGISYKDKLKICFPDVDYDEKVCNCICNMCCENLKIVYEFRQLYIKNVELLRLWKEGKLSFVKNSEEPLISSDQNVRIIDETSFDMENHLKDGETIGNNLESDLVFFSDDVNEICIQDGLDKSNEQADIMSLIQNFHEGQFQLAENSVDTEEYFEEIVNSETPNDRDIFEDGRETIKNACTDLVQKEVSTENKETKKVDAKNLTNNNEIVNETEAVMGTVLENTATDKNTIDSGEKLSNGYEKCTKLMENCIENVNNSEINMNQTKNIAEEVYEGEDKGEENILTNLNKKTDIFINSKTSYLQNINEEILPVVTEKPHKTLKPKNNDEISKIISEFSDDEYSSSCNEINRKISENIVDQFIKNEEPIPVENKPKYNLNMPCSSPMTETDEGSNDISNHQIFDDLPEENISNATVQIFEDVCGENEETFSKYKDISSPMPIKNQHIKEELIIPENATQIFNENSSNEGENDESHQIEETLLGNNQLFDKNMAPNIHFEEKSSNNEIIRGNMDQQTEENDQIPLNTVQIFDGKCENHNQSSCSLSIIEEQGIKQVIEEDTKNEESCMNVENQHIICSIPISNESVKEIIEKNKILEETKTITTYCESFKNKEKYFIETSPITSEDDFDQFEIDYEKSQKIKDKRFKRKLEGNKHFSNSKKIKINETEENKTKIKDILETKTKTNEGTNLLEEKVEENIHEINGENFKNISEFNRNEDIKMYIKEKEDDWDLAGKNMEEKYETSNENIDSEMIESKSQQIKVDYISSEEIEENLKYITEIDKNKSKINEIIATDEKSDLNITSESKFLSNCVQEYIVRKCNQEEKSCETEPYKSDLKTVFEIMETEISGKSEKVEIEKILENSLTVVKKNLEKLKILKKIICPVCKKTFEKLAYFRRHRRFKCQIKFKCDICEKEFNFSKNLEIHSSVHDINSAQKFTEKLKKCEICNLLIPPNDFRNHKLKHESELTSSKIKLARPKKNHKYKKVYSCKICEKSFQNIQILIEHKKSHENVLSLECDQCFDRFSDENDLKNHKQEHEHLSEMKCCGKSFSDDREYYKHLQNHLKKSKI